MAGKLFGAVIEPEVVEPPATPPVVNAPTPPEVAEEPPEPPTPTPPAPAPAPAPPVSISDVRQAVRDEMRQAAPPAPAPVAPQLELAEEDAEDLKGIRYLESTGKLPKGKSDEHLAFVKKNYEYQDKWVEANPGKKFNPDDEEHKDWYDANTPEGLTDRTTINKAINDANIDEQVEKRWNEKMKPKIDMQAAEDAFQREMPVIANRVDTRIVALVEKVDPNLAKLLIKDGKPNLGKEAEAAIAHADPIASDELNEVIGSGLLATLVELEKLPIPECRKMFNPEGNPIHRIISNEITAAEKSMATASRDVQTVDGRLWISAAEYDRRLKDGPADQMEARRSELDRTTWQITVDDIADLLIDGAAKKTKALIDRTNKKLEKYGKTLAPASTNPPVNGNEPPAPPAPPAPNPPAARRGSPSISSSADVTSPGSPAGGNGDSFVDPIMTKIFSK